MHVYNYGAITPERCCLERVCRASLCPPQLLDKVVVSPSAAPHEKKARWSLVYSIRNGTPEVVQCPWSALGGSGEWTRIHTLAVSANLIAPLLLHFQYT